MADAVITRILDNLVTTLRGITKDNGYSRDVNHVSATAETLDPGLRDSITVAGVSELKEDADATAGRKVILTVLLDCRVEESDKLPKAIHDLAADIETILALDYDRGGTAIDTDVKGTLYAVSEDMRPLGACNITVEIPYKHKHGDPRTVA